MARNVLTFAGIIIIVGGCFQIPDRELAARVKAAQPDWQSYLEDLKGQVGAGPVAQWQGTPVHARKTQNELLISFEISGSWVKRVCYIPVMIREPRGAVFVSADAEKDDSCARYKFQLPQMARDVPWVELKYPTGQIRLVFSDSGEWKRSS